MHDSDLKIYFTTLPQLHQRIAYFFLERRHDPEIKIANSSIAEAIGCTTRTVTRATTRLQKDGFLIKLKKNCRHDPNIFIINIEID